MFGSGENIYCLGRTAGGFDCRSDQAFPPKWMVSWGWMYLRFSLLFLGSVFLYGQASSPSTASEIQDLRKQVGAGLVARSRVDQAKDAIAAAHDAELLTAPVSSNDLTELRAAELLQAAQRQVDRANARLNAARAMVDAGLTPRRSLDDPTEELSQAHSIYDLTVARTQLVQQVAEMAHLEEEAEQASAAAQISHAESPAELESFPPVMEKFAGAGSFTRTDFARVKQAFEEQFHAPLPVSADGETAVHVALGFDHRNRVDVALVPDTAEGVWLRHYLEASAIPYYAFRSSVPGKATGAHIHIGPPSGHLQAAAPMQERS